MQPQTYHLEPAFAWLPWAVVGCFAVGFILFGWSILRLRNLYPPDISSRTIDQQKAIGMALLGRVIGGDPELRLERNLLFLGFGLCLVPMVCMFLVLRFALTPVIT